MHRARRPQRAPQERSFAGRMPARIDPATRRIKPPCRSSAGWPQPRERGCCPDAQVRLPRIVARVKPVGGRCQGRRARPVARMCHCLELAVPGIVHLDRPSWFGLAEAMETNRRLRRGRGRDRAGLSFVRRMSSLGMACLGWGFVGVAVGALGCGGGGGSSGTSGFGSQADLKALLGAFGVLESPAGEPVKPELGYLRVRADEIAIVESGTLRARSISDQPEHVSPRLSIDVPGGPLVYSASVPWTSGGAANSAHDAVICSFSPSAVVGSGWRYGRAGTGLFAQAWFSRLGSPRHDGSQLLLAGRTVVCLSASGDVAFSHDLDQAGWSGSASWRADGSSVVEYGVSVQSNAIYVGSYRPTGESLGSWMIPLGLPEITASPLVFYAESGGAVRLFVSTLAGAVARSFTVVLSNVGYPVAVFDGWIPPPGSTPGAVLPLGAGHSSWLLFGRDPGATTALRSSPVSTDGGASYFVPRLDFQEPLDAVPAAGLSDGQRILVCAHEASGETMLASVSLDWSIQWCKRFVATLDLIDAHGGKCLLASRAFGQQQAQSVLVVDSGSGEIERSYSLAGSLLPGSSAGSGRFFRPGGGLLFWRGTEAGGTLLHDPIDGSVARTWSWGGMPGVGSGLHWSEGMDLAALDTGAWGTVFLTDAAARGPGAMECRNGGPAVSQSYASLPQVCFAERLAFVPQSLALPALAVSPIPSFSVERIPVTVAVSGRDLSVSPACR
jgi:hypothetical protein